MKAKDMDYSPSTEQIALITEARQFAQEKLMSDAGAGHRPVVPTIASSDHAAHQAAKAYATSDFATLWKSCMQAGLTGLLLPQKNGGRELSLVDAMLMFEAMAGTGADRGFLFALGVHQFAAAIALANIGTSGQKERWLGAMTNGAAIGALAISEQQAGSDSYAMQARASETASGFRLSGEKLWITNAPVADVFLICARTGDAPGMFGISCFIVPTTAKGLSVTQGPDKLGLRGAPWGAVSLDGVDVTGDDLLGGLGGGGAVFRESMRWERCGLFAIALGAMQHSLDACLSHVRQRQQFGRPLADNDIVAKSVVLMQTRLEAARLMLYKAAQSIDKGQADDAQISMAKALVSESAVTNALAAQELYGALGILADGAPATFLTDMLPFRILSGPTEVQYAMAFRLLMSAARRN